MAKLKFATLEEAQAYMEKIKKGQKPKLFPSPLGRMRIPVVPYTYTELSSGYRIAKLELE